MPKEVAKLLDQVLSFDCRDTELPLSLPPRCLRVEDEPSLYVKMWDVNLTTVSPTEDIPTFEGGIVSAGAFGVAKKGSDLFRLIIDKRPQKRRGHSTVGSSSPKLHPA